MNEAQTTPVEQTEATATPVAATKPKRASKPKAAKKAAPVKAKGKKAAKAKGDGVKGPQVLRKYAAGEAGNKPYLRDNEHKTANGHVSVHCGDDTAKKLLGKDLDTVYALASKALKEPEASLRKKYAHLNVGMQRMNLGNRIRAAA